MRGVAWDLGKTSSTKTEFKDGTKKLSIPSHIFHNILVIPHTHGFQNSFGPRTNLFFHSISHKLSGPHSFTVQRPHRIPKTRTEGHGQRMTAPKACWEWPHRHQNRARWNWGLASCLPGSPSQRRAFPWAAETDMHSRSKISRTATLPNITSPVAPEAAQEPDTNAS